MPDFELPRAPSDTAGLEEESGPATTFWFRPRHAPRQQQQQQQQQETGPDLMTPSLGQQTAYRTRRVQRVKARDQGYPAGLGHPRFPDMPCMKRVYRHKKGAGPLVRSQEQRALLVPRINQLSTACQPVVVFVLLERRSGDASSMPRRV